MPKSCLSVFPHCERKRQNNPFQIRTFHFHPFFSSLCLRFTFSSLPTFFPKQVYLYGVIWVAMAPLQRKRPRQFVSSYSFERIAVLGRIILLLSPGLHSWQLSEVRLRSGCSGPPGYTMLYTRLPLVSTCVPLVSYSPAFRMMCLVCLDSAHPAALDRQRQETTTKQRGRPAAANIHQQHLPKEESKRKARAPTKDTKEQPKKGREGERTRKSKPGKTRSKTRSKRDANEIRALAAANSRKAKSEGWITWRRSLHGITHWRSTSRQNPAAAAGRTQQQQAAAGSSKQQQAAAGSSRQQQAAAGSSRQNAGRTQQQQAAAGSSRQQQAAAGSSRQQQAEPSSSTQNRAQAGRTEHKQAESSRHRFQQEGTEPYRT